MKKVTSRWKRVVSAVAAVAVMCSPVTPFGGAGADEVHGASSSAVPAWAQPYMDNLVNRNIMRGDANGNLRPNDNISRAEFAALVNRTFGFKVKGKKSFGDVKKTDWFADDISIGANQGFFAGMDSGKAEPNSPLTREQAVTMLCRAVKIPEENLDPLNFSDSKKFQNWSKGSIYAAAGKGFVSGFNDQSFKPQKSITRAEVAKMLSDMSGEIVNQPTQMRYGYVNGNVTLNRSGAGLRNTTINGDLYITEGVGAGNVILDGVTVLGNVIISGAGESNVGASSIIAYNCNFNNVIIDVGHDKIVSMIAEGNSRIANTVVKSKAFLEERDSGSSSAFENVQLKGPEKTSLDLSGNFNTVSIEGPKNILNLRRGQIERLIADETATEPEIQLDKNTYVDQLYTDTATSVKGTGKIGSIVVQTNGTKVEGLPDDITIRPGVIANIDGKDMTYDDAERDKATPTIDSKYPQIIEILPNGATGVIKVNKPGKIYWMVKAPYSNAPTKDNLKDPKKDTGVIISGNYTTAADKEILTRLSGLLSGEEYVFYAMLEDMREDCSSIESATFRTVDNLKPTIITGFPQGEGVYDEAEKHMLKYTLVPSKNASVYWATLPKGSIAPTVDVLINDPLKVPGAVDAGKEICTKNEVLSFFAKGLKEKTEYDTYMALKDDAGNQSQIYKLTTSTLDVTPPEFQTNYPKLGTITNNSVNMIYMTDETCTLYWALYPRGTKVPSSCEVPNPKPDDRWTELWSPEAKQEVMTGNNALKFGKANATVDREGNFTISGLTAQTPYDLYFVLVDASGNKSDAVLKWEVSTKDSMEPTAVLEFDPAYVSEAGEPKVGSDIRLVFSEIVYDGTATTKTLLKDVLVSKLGDYIQIYDTSTTPRRQLEVGDNKDIDFSMALFSEENGCTVITFRSADILPGSNLLGKDAALKLASGNRYVFELRSVVDAMGNKMKSNAAGAVTKLPEFRTMSPFVALKDKGSSTSEGAYDISFEVDPQIQNASDELVFDVIVETDTEITCEIIKKDKDGNPIGTRATGVQLQPNKFYAMQAIMDSNNIYTDYTPFNALERVTYEIKVTNLDGVAERELWNKKLTMDFRGVSGTKQNMIDAAFAGGSKRFDDVQSTLKVTVVSDPLKLTCNKYFSDVNEPKFELNTERKDQFPDDEYYPLLMAGDTSISVLYKLDKACTVYWLLAPADTISDIPDPIEIINGSRRPDGSRTGKIEIPSAKTEYKGELIQNLEPNTKYKFFYVAKSNSFSRVTGKKEVITRTVVKPEISIINKAGQDADGANVEVGIINADGDVYWVVYETGVRKLDDGSGDPDIIYAKDIAGVSIQPDSRVIDRGQTVIQKDDKDIIKVKNLKPERFYDIFVVAKNPMAEPVEVSWCMPRVLTGITSADTEPPAVVEGSDVTTITRVRGTTPPRRYDGTFYVSFTEPLYYVTGNMGTRKALKVSDLQSMLKLPPNLGTITSITGTAPGNDQAIIGFTMSFENVNVNSLIKIDSAIYDTSGNKAGQQLQMVLVEKKTDDPDQPYTAEWKLTFGK